MTEAFCVKERVKRTMVNPTKVTLKNGRQGIKGTCSVCGTTMFKIVG